MRVIDILAVVLIIAAWNHGLVRDETSIVRIFILISLGRAETALRRVIHANWVLLAEERGSDLSVRLGHGVAVNHATHVTGIAWDLLAADHVGRARNPVL